MKFKSDGNWTMGDMWGLVSEGIFHGIHIKWSDAETPLGHVVSPDLLHFTAVDDVLYPLPESEYPEDCLMKFTGCAITGKDNRHYIFYTMRNKKASEKIAVAISDDMKNFKLYDKNPVLQPDENIFYTQGSKVDCRDLMVVYDEKADIYYGYFAAMAELGYGTPCGVIGVATSKDLLSWSEQKIAYKPPFMGVMEVPDVFEIDGKYYMTLLSGNIYGAKGISEDEDVVYFTYYAVSDSPKGPFEHQKDMIFIGGNNSSGAVCRTVVFNGRRYVIYIDRGKYGSSISLPKEVIVKDGKLCPCYAPVIQKLRTGKVVGKFSDNMIKRLTGSHGWNTVSGNIKTSPDGNIIELSTFINSCQKYRLENIKYPSLEIECSFLGDCNELGFMFEAYSNEECVQPKETSYLSMNFVKNKIIAYYSKLEYIPYSKRGFTFEKNTKYHVRAIVMEGVFEIYINDVLILQGPMETCDYIIPGFVLVNGSCKLENLKVFELEK